MAQSHHVETAGRHARQKNGGFVGFAAGAGEETLLQVARGDLRDFFRQRHDVLVGIKRGGMLQPIDLRVHFRSDLGIAMPNRNGKDAAKKVQILVPVEIPDVLHLAAIGHQRLFKVVGDRRPQEFFMFGDDFLTARFCGAQRRWCWSYRSGHNAVLASSVGCRRVYDAALLAASRRKAERLKRTRQNGRR